MTAARRADRQSERSERNASKRFGNGPVSQCLHGINEGFPLTITPSKPGSPDRWPQRKSPFKGERDKNGIRLL